MVKHLLAGGLAVLLGMAFAYAWNRHRAPERKAFDRDWCV